MSTAVVPGACPFELTGATFAHWTPEAGWRLNPAPRRDLERLSPRRAASVRERARDAKAERRVRRARYSAWRRSMEGSGESGETVAPESYPSASTCATTPLARRPGT